MAVSETLNLLKKKLLKILGFLILVRLGLFIPVPGVDLDVLPQNQVTNSLVGLARNLTGSSFLSIGSLGILPYINASIAIQLLTQTIPALQRLQKEEGELGQQQIRRYTRYLAFGWALILSAGLAFTTIKPVVFNWSIQLALKIILSLTTGSMLSMWFSELITNENLGNGSSMIIFINIIGGLPPSINESLKNLNSASSVNNLSTIFIAFVLYLLIVSVIVLVQDSYKKVNIVSARQLNYNSQEQNSKYSELKNSYIPIKLNQGGILPLVFSTTLSAFLLYPIQLLLKSTVGSSLIVLTSYGLNIVLVVFFSTFFALVTLKPKELSESLTKTAYNIPGLKQGKETTQYLEQVISRLAFMGGLFLAFLAIFPLVLGNLFSFNIFRNLTSLLILIGVITDVSSQIRGYLVSQNYESFKKA